MRWAEVPIRFARPIHWILALFGGEVIPFEMGNIRSGNVTYGHRFMHPGPIPVKDFRFLSSKDEEALSLLIQWNGRKGLKRRWFGKQPSVSGRVLKR